VICLLPVKGPGGVSVSNTFGDLWGLDQCYPVPMSFNLERKVTGGSRSM
jgi:hypothetical protein